MTSASGAVPGRSGAARRGLVVADVHFRLGTEHGRQGRLRVKVDCQHPVAAKRKEVRKVGASGRFGAPAFEIYDGKNLKVIASAPMRQEPQSVGRLLCREHVAQLVDLGKRVGAVVVVEPGRDWTLAFVRHGP